MFAFGKYGKGKSVKASASKDGLVVKSDTTRLNFDALFIGPGVTGNIVVSRDGGTTVSPAYPVVGPMTLNVSGNRVMATDTTYTGGVVIWQNW
jgi:NADPH-dependent 2,4-dienoyl-CoA reductase/sulfur reductase-like enzyme